MINFEFINSFIYEAMLALFGDKTLVLCFSALAGVTAKAVFVVVLSIVCSRFIDDVVWHLKARKKANIQLVSNDVVVPSHIQHRLHLPPLPSLPMQQVIDHPCDDGDDLSITWSFDDDDGDEDSLAYSSDDTFYISSDEEEDDEETLSEKSFDDDGNTEEQKIDIPTVIKVTGVDNRGDDGNGETVEWSFFDDDDSSLCYSTDTNENSDDEDEDDDENENGENNNEELIVPTEDHEISIPSVFEVAIDIPPPVAVEAVRPLRRSSRNRKKPVRFVDEYTRYY